MFGYYSSRRTCLCKYLLTWMNLILRQYRVLIRHERDSWKFVEATVSWQSDSCEHGFTRRHTHLVEMTQVPPVEVSEAWRQSLESWRLNLHGLKAAHCLFVWSGKKPWVVVKRGWHLMYYSSRKEIYNSSIFYHDFFTNRFQCWKTHRCFVLGWILRTLFGIHFFTGSPCDFFL